MALPKIENVELHTMDQWFANLVDTINYDLQLLQKATALPLTEHLTNVDTSPIEYLNSSLQNMVKNINSAFDMINEKLGDMDSRIKQLKQPGGQ